MSNTREPSELLHDAKMSEIEEREAMSEEQESAEALANEISEACRLFPSGTRHVVLAIINADRARVRAEARRKALGDACRKLQERLEAHRSIGGLGDQIEESSECLAAIRALMDEPGDGEG